MSEKQEILERYQDSRSATIATWRRLFNEETGGSYYRQKRANMGFSLNDYPHPYDYTIVEFSSRPTLEITNGQIVIIPQQDV